MMIQSQNHFEKDCLRGCKLCHARIMVYVRCRFTKPTIFRTSWNSQSRRGRFVIISKRNVTKFQQNIRRTLEKNFTTKRQKSRSKTWNIYEICEIFVRDFDTFPAKAQLLGSKRDRGSKIEGSKREKEQIPEIKRDFLSTLSCNWTKKRIRMKDRLDSAFAWARKIGKALT